MKIALDKIKYRKRIFSLFTGTIIFGIAAILVILINIVKNNGLTLERILLVLGLTALASLFGYLTKFYYPIRKLNNVIIYEDRVLNDYSKPFNRAIDLKIEAITSINRWSSSRGINQYKIVTKNHDQQRNALINQLKGNHIYISDYVVDSLELEKLMLQIENDCKSTQQ